MLTHLGFKKQDPKYLKLMQEEYPEKAISLFRLYHCLESKSVKQKKKWTERDFEKLVFDCDEIAQFLEQWALSRIDPLIKEQIRKFLSSQQQKEPDDVIEPAIQLAQEIKHRKLPCDKIKILEEAFILAQTARAFEDLGVDDS